MNEELINKICEYELKIAQLKKKIEREKEIIKILRNKQEIKFKALKVQLLTKI